MGISATIYNKQDISLNAALVCEHNEVLALVGPSGSGKTTLLNSISGLFTPEHGLIVCSGQTWFDSENRINMPVQQRKTGMVFQHYALFPHLSVLDNIILPLKKTGIKQARSKALHLLERVNLSGLEHRYPSMLSGGQQQRVALARALARQPKILLLDEPFSAVDQVTRRKLRMEMAGLTRVLNIPVILVTHDLDEASMFADKLCVIHNGETLQTGTVEQIMKSPASATVARLIDIRNIFEGTLIRHDEYQQRSYISWQGMEIEIPYTPGNQVNEKIYWCINASDVMLHRRIQPSRGEKENPVYGNILEMMVVNGTVSLLINVGDQSDIKLHADIPEHVARRNRIKKGERIGVSLIRKSIHLMPYQVRN